MIEEELLHIAIIPDGNRRWAKERTWHPWKGHEQAIENFRSLTKWCQEDPRVGYLTVWCFSTENWKRDPQEVEKLMTMLEEYLRKERDGFLKEKVRFLHTGRKDRIPPSLAELIEEVEEQTKDETESVLNLAVDYGGKDEIVRAINKIEDPASITEESFRNHLDHPDLPDIDLVIRTSGEKRISNFFLWQTAYAEWDYIDKYFPDFTIDDLDNSVNAFAERTRRFGG